jgi:hypothetical protein
MPSSVFDTVTFHPIIRQWFEARIGSSWRRWRPLTRRRIFGREIRCIAIMPPAKKSGDSDLLQAVSRHSDFPVLVETYRECLQDVFDLKALKTIIHGLAQKTVRLQVVDTSIPSPMAAGLLFKFVSIYLYEEDQSRQLRGRLRPTP